MYTRYFAIYICLLLVVSCKVGKDYQRPEFDLPEKYRNETDTNNDTSALPHNPRDFFKNKYLLELIDNAFEKNSDLLLAVQNIALAESTLGTVKLNYLPEINAQINSRYTKASRNSSSGQAGGNLEIRDFNLSAGLTWAIDIWGKIKREKEEALANYLQSQEVRKAVQTKLVADIAKGYYNLLMLDKQLEIANRSKVLSDSTLTMMKIQYQVGDANILGIRQVEAQLNENKILISQIEQSISLQENALDVLCGTYAGAITRKVEDNKEFISVPIEGYPASLLASRPDIKAAELSLRASNARVGIEQAAMYPAINISAEGGLNSLASSNWFSIPASLFETLAGGITQPIFNKGKLKAQYEQAKIEREKEVIRFRQAVLDGYTQVSNALKNKEEIEKQFIFAVTRQKALEEGVASTQLLFRAGTVTYLDIITVQSAYLQSSLQRVQLYKDKALADIELYYALGGGWQ